MIKVVPTLIKDFYLNAKAHIEEDVVYGDYVHIKGFKDNPLQIYIGHGVRIGDHVRIAVGGKVIIEDGVTLHNHVSILGNGDCHIRHGSWIAQYTALDCEGGLEIGENCCIGFHCQIWSHVKRAPYLPGYRFESKKKTIIGDRAWLMGGMITVSPGVHIGHDSIIFSNSVVSHDTEPSRVYAGIPAKKLDQYSSVFKEQHDSII